MAARQPSSTAGSRAPDRIDLVLHCADPSLAEVARTLLTDVLPALDDWSARRHLDVRLHERWPHAAPADPRDPLLALLADPAVFVFAIFGRELTMPDQLLLTTALRERPRNDPRARYLFAYAEQDVDAGRSIPRRWFDHLVDEGRHAYAVPSRPDGAQLSTALVRWLEEGLTTSRPEPMARPGSGIPLPASTPSRPPGPDADLELLPPSAPDREPEPADPLPVDENVQFTVYRPHAVRPDTWYPLLAFAHLAERRPEAPADQPDPLDRVKALAAQALGDQAATYGSPGADSRGGVPREGLLTFVPHIEGVEFNPRSASFEWREDVHQQSFRLRAQRETVGRTVRGRLTVYLGAFLLADVDLAFRVEESAPGPPSPRPQPAPPLAVHTAAALPAASSPAMGTVSAAPYRKVFPSYSHRDLVIVRQAEAYGRALGDVYLRDRTTLRSGEQWNERLLALIEEADVFQLFWSRNSMRSDYVRREWEHAVSLRRPGFVRPTYWEVPMPESADPRLPPAELADLHFHGFTEQPEQEPRPDEAVPSPPSAPPAFAPTQSWGAPPPPQSYGGAAFPAQPYGATPNPPVAAPRRGRSIVLIAGAGLAVLAVVVVVIVVLSRL